LRDQVDNLLESSSDSLEAEETFENFKVFNLTQINANQNIEH